MTIKSKRIILVLAAIMLGFLPFLLSSTLHMAYDQDVIAEKPYLRCLYFSTLLKKPGLILTETLGMTPYFWVSHSRGSMFWLHYFEFFVGNIAGWFMILGLFWMSIRVASRDKPGNNSKLSSTDATGLL